MKTRRSTLEEFNQTFHYILEMGRMNNCPKIRPQIDTEYGIRSDTKYMDKYSEKYWILRQNRK